MTLNRLKLFLIYQDVLADNLVSPTTTQASTFPGQLIIIGDEQNHVDDATEAVENTDTVQAVEGKMKNNDGEAGVVSFCLCIGMRCC